MKEIVNSITAWQMLQLLVLVYFFLNFLLARKFIMTADKSAHVIDKVFGSAVFMLFGLPVIIHTSIKQKK
jgi:hypothetical protein